MKTRARLSELSKRAIITVALLVFAGIVSYLPVPGVSIPALREFAERLRVYSFPANYFFLTNVISKVSIGVLGIKTLFGWAIFVQILSLFIPSLRRRLFGDRNDARDLFKFIVKWTLVTIVIQAFFVSLWIENPNSFSGHVLVANPGAGFRFLCVLSLTAGFIVLLLFAEAINRYGIGNGYALIFIGYYLIEFPLHLFQVFRAIAAGQLSIEPVFLTALVFAGLIAAMSWATRWVKYFEVPTSTGNIQIPLRLTWLGEEPLGWATLIIFLPAIPRFLNMRVPLLSELSAALNNPYVSLVAYPALIFIFAHLYIRVIYKDTHFLTSLQNQDIQFLTPPEELKGNLSRSIKNLCNKHALFFSLAFCVPGFLSHVFSLPPILSKFGSNSMHLLFVGIFFDTFAQAKFYQNIRSSGEKWVLYSVYPDETSQTAACHKLSQEGIKTLVKPYRFSWWLPLRTPLEFYQIYTVQVQKNDHSF